MTISTEAGSTKARAAIVRAVNAPWTIEDVEVSAPREDEVLVRMVGTGICHTDITCREGHFPVPMPIVLGHEGAGVVESVGAKVTLVACDPSAVDQHWKTPARMVR